MTTDWSAYKLADGTSVPGVHKVMKNLGWSTSGLVKWAYNKGKRGEELYGERDDAADLGKLVHGAVENVLKYGADVRDAMSEVDDSRVKNTLKSFDRWLQAWGPEVLEIEVPLVSEEHRFCGRLDLVARMQNAVAILDVKTGGIYDESWCQPAAYRVLWDENRPTQQVEEVHLLALGKGDNVGFDHKWKPIEELEPYWQIFKHCLGLHELRKQI